jgi:hypothetical protein
MPTMYVNLSGLDSSWTKPCQQAVTDLNGLFKRNGIDVVLTTRGGQGLPITVKTDPSIQGDAVHGRTSAEVDGSGKMVRAEVRLPVKVTINSPGGVRPAGTGVLAVIAGHEFVHALGHSGHNSHLMSQTFYKAVGDSAGGDKLKAGSASLPPLTLSPESISELQGIWS